jgi:hypothetical protein
VTAKLDGELHTPNDVNQAQFLLQAAQKHVQVLNKKALELHVTYLEDQISQLQDEDEGKR